MSRKHRRLTRTWHATPRRFKHGSCWCTYDTKVPKGVGYVTEYGLMTWPNADLTGLSAPVLWGLPTNPSLVQPL